MTSRVPLLAFAVVLSACHAGPRVDGADMNPRYFADGAIVRSLVARIDTIGPAPTTERCIVRRTDDGFLLTAELAPVVSPMPPIDARSTRVLRDSANVRVVSRWGIDGTAGPYVGTFTHHPPARDGFAIVVALEGERAVVRSTTADGPRGEGMDREHVVAALAPASGGRALVVLAPDSDLTVTDVARWLAALDALEAPIALGMVLTTDRDLAPNRTSPPAPDADRCDALPSLASEGPVGALTPDVLRASLGPLRDAILRCAALVPTRAVAEGGRLRVGVRIGPAGEANHVCVTDDDVGDDAFRICVADAARHVRWPVPSPAGFVDAYLPLVVAPDRSAEHRGLCVD